MPKIKDFLEMMTKYDPEDTIEFKVEMHVTDHNKQEPIAPVEVETT